jgi:hypothetical protein
MLKRDGKARRVYVLHVVLRCCVGISSLVMSRSEEMSLISMTSS